MNLAVSTALAALATSLALEIIAPAPLPPVVVVSQPSVFLAGASVMIAADGSCATSTDAHVPLLGTVGSQPEASAAPGPEVAAAEPPPGGSCGGHLDATASAVPAPDVPDALLPQAPEVASSEPAAEPAAAPRPAARPRPPRSKPPAEPLAAWWPARKPDTLNVLFVGEAVFGSAISILTDGTFDSADSANTHVEVKDAAGRQVSRRWQLATNRKMLLLPVKAGVYTVSIRSELADAQGRQTGTASGGAVYVR